MSGVELIPPSFASFKFLKILLVQLNDFFSYFSIKFNDIYLKTNVIKLIERGFG